VRNHVNQKIKIYHGVMEARVKITGVQEGFF